MLDDTTYIEALGTSVVTEVIYDENGSIIGAIKSMAEDTIFHNGIAYTMNSAEAKQAETSWKWIRGFTIKTGANYNIDLNNNVFFNIGYISKAPRFNNIYDYSNNLYSNIENEIVKAVEGDIRTVHNLFPPMPMRILPSGKINLQMVECLF